MRTVTFSDRAVAEFVNEHFVAFWHNRGPGFHNEEFSTEQWISGLEAYPTKNICTFFLNPAGRVVYYAAGYYRPKLFLEILKFAAKPDRYLDRAKGMETAAAKIRHGHVQAAYRHLAEVLRDLGGRTELPTLADLQFSYKYGNEFTEEPSGGGRAAVASGVFVEREPDPAPVPKRAVSPAHAKIRELREAFDRKSARLWDPALPANERQAIQDELVKLADELTRWESRARRS